MENPATRICFQEKRKKNPALAMRNGILFLDFRASRILFR
jgi:hypothetical protein